MNLYLISPVLAFELALHPARHAAVDKLVLFAAPASVLGLIVAHLLIRPTILHALLFPFYLLVATDLFVVAEYQTRLTSSVISVVLENWSDAGGYIEHHRNSILIAATLVIGFYAVGMLAIRGIRLRPTRRLRALAISFLVMVYAAVTIRQAKTLGSITSGAMDMISHDRSSPFGIFAQGFMAYRVYRVVVEHRRATRDFSFGATRRATTAEPEIVVLVIGESVRRDHWSLYGYGRNTTPRLAREANVVTFRNVVTQAALTQIAVPLMLTRNTIDRNDIPETSIVTLFGEVGFTTHWFSTQQRDQYTGAINRYSAEADDVRFLNRQHDGALVDLVRSVLVDAPSGAKHFFVLHTQGSHAVYDDRCPPQHRIFAVGDELSEHERLINSYDNAIAYTDTVLAELISVLKQRAGIAALLYVPDHGENLKDDARGLLGHFYNNEYDLPIPMAFWYSDSFAARFNAKVASMYANATKRVNTQAVFYTLVDAADVSLNDSRMLTASLLSPDWVEVPRRVFSGWDGANRARSVDYDAVFGATSGDPGDQARIGTR
jgi:heptose-I-phosphate ethanolaminephosphotransferase